MGRDSQVLLSTTIEPHLRDATYDLQQRKTSEDAVSSSVGRAKCKGCILWRHA